jgi:hypothetical protein
MRAIRRLTCVLGSVVLLLAAAGCSSKTPPAVTLRFEDRSVRLAPHTFSWHGRSVDGPAPIPLPDVGDTAEIAVQFPAPGWSFTATFSPAGARCGRMQTVPLERRYDGDFVLRPAGNAGVYDVTLWGHGGGTVAAAFRWTTPARGPLPVPEARVALLSDHDGRTDSYGVELVIVNLARTPRRATATISVRASNGRSLRFDATLGRSACRPEGSVFFDGPTEKGTPAAALGPRPFTYEVVLALDGARYTAVAKWPHDVIDGNEPSVALRFEPALPGLR